MAVILLHRSLDSSIDRPAGPHDPRIRPYRPPADADLVRSLTEGQTLGSDSPTAPDGLVGELASRPNRSVEAWLATGAPDAGSRSCLGLVAVVTSGQGLAPRHSIAWLLVRPSARRQGLGRALVAVALDAVRAAGGRSAWVEVHTGRPEALAFWTAMGFDPDRRRRVV